MLLAKLSLALQVAVIIERHNEGTAMLNGAGAHAAGRVGRALVVAFALVELFGGTCIVLLVVWQQLALLLPADGEQFSRLASYRGMCLLPYVMAYCAL